MCDNATFSGKAFNVPHSLVFLPSVGAEMYIVIVFLKRFVQCHMIRCVSSLKSVFKNGNYAYCILVLFIECFACRKYVQKA